MCKPIHISTTLEVLSKKTGYDNSLHNRLKFSSNSSKIISIIHNLTHCISTIGDNRVQHHQQLLLSPVLGDIENPYSEAKKLPTIYNYFDHKITVLYQDTNNPHFCNTCKYIQYPMAKHIRMVDNILYILRMCNKIQSTMTNHII